MINSTPLMTVNLLFSSNYFVYFYERNAKPIVDLFGDLYNTIGIVETNITWGFSPSSSKFVRIIKPERIILSKIKTTLTINFYCLNNDSLESINILFIITLWITFYSQHS